MKDQDKTIVARFRDLVSKKVKVQEMIVFGSRARGNATEDSDLDILVVVDNPDHSTERYVSDCAWEAGFPEDVIVMPVVISLEALKNSPIRSSVFIRNVYEEGVAA